MALLGEQLLASLLTIRTNDSTGVVHPVQTTSNDWQISHSVINGYGGNILAGPCSMWSDVHWVAGTPTTGAGPALIEDYGAQSFDQCYFDGTTGTAIIDRTNANNRSEYSNCFVLQSVTNITGIPIFKETASSNAGVSINNFRTQSLASGSTFSYFIQSPISTSMGKNISIDSGWLTGAFSDQSIPTGHWSGIPVGGVQQDYISALTASGRLAVTGGYSMTQVVVTSSGTSSVNTAIELVSGSNITRTLPVSSSARILYKNTGTSAINIACPISGSAPSIDGLSSINLPPNCALEVIGTSSAIGVWSILNAYVIDSVSALAPTGSVAETFPRSGASMSNTLSILSTQTLVVSAVYLQAGQTIGHFHFIAGTTGVASPTNWWMNLLSSSLVQVAISADQTTTAITASTSVSLAIATIASGSSTSYLVTSSGLYYIGLMVNDSSAVPTLYGINGQSGSNNTPPIITGYSDINQTTPPGFPHTATAITAKQPIPYFWLT